MIEPASSKDLLGTFGVNWKLFLAQLVNFSIVLVVMWKWVYTPLIKLMDTRAKEITEGLVNATAAQQKLAEAATERDHMLRETRGEAQRMIEETKKKAQGIHEEKMALVKQEIEQLVGEAKGRIQNERNVAFGVLQNEVATLVALATKKVAGQMSESAQRTHIAEAMKELQNG